MNLYKKLIGERIYLSPRTIEAAEQFTEWLNDFKTTDYIGRSHQIMTIEAEREYLETHMDKGAVFYIVTLEENKFIGTVGIESMDNIMRKGTLGVFIGDQEYREKGYGTEAIKLVLDYGFNYLNLHNIKLDVYEYNNRAYNCYKKCGFKECGRRREAMFLDGKYYDSIEMDILESEFTEKVIRNRNI